MNDTIIISEIEKYISFLKKLSNEDLIGIHKKDIEIVFEIREKQKANKAPISQFNDKDINDIIQTLNSISERNIGEEYLRSVKLNRQELEIILKKLDIHFLRKDPIMKLYDKIIEGTIGYKLRSNAIQKK